MNEANKNELPEWLKWVFWIGLCAAIAIGMYEYGRLRRDRDDRVIELINDQARRNRGEADTSSERHPIEHAKLK